MNQSEFTVTLVSNASYDIFPNNSVFQFTNVLSQNLRFSQNEKWMVCLNSISVSNIIEGYAEAYSQIQKQEDIYSSQAVRSLRYLTQRSTSESDKINIYNTLNKNYLKLMQTKVDFFNEQNPVFVKCEEVKPREGGSKLIGSFNVPPYTGKNIFTTYEPSTEEYFSLDSNFNNSFTIKIVNSQGKVFKSTLSQPTIVVLKFKKMEFENFNEHTLHIDNGTQSPTDFLISFPDALVRDGQQNPWEIAISRLNIIPLFKTFPKGEYLLRVIRDVEEDFQNLTTQNWDDYFSKHTVGETYISYNEEFNQEMLVSYLNKKLIELGKRIRLKIKCNLTPKSKILVSFQKNTKSKKKKKPNESEMDNNTLMKNKPSSLVDESEMLNDEPILVNDEPMNMASKFKKSIYFLVLPSHLISVLGLDGEGIVYNGNYGAIPMKGTTYGKREVDLDFLRPKNLLLYTDCVVPSLIGNVFGQYLTNIPIPATTDSAKSSVPYISYEPKNLEYHPLKTGDLNNVRFRMYQTDGSIPEFSVSSIKIFMSIIFRKKKKKQ